MSATCNLLVIVLCDIFLFYTAAGLIWALKRFDRPIRLYEFWVLLLGRCFLYSWSLGGGGGRRKQPLLGLQWQNGLHRCWCLTLSNIRHTVSIQHHFLFYKENRLVNTLSGFFLFLALFLDSGKSWPKSQVMQNLKIKVFCNILTLWCLNPYVPMDIISSEELAIHRIILSAFDNRSKF
jgi:hypothetical protein